MKGCKVCFNCGLHLVNRRDEITPCADRYRCEIYLEHLEQERKRNLEAKERRAIEVAHTSRVIEEVLKDRKKNRRR